MARLTRIALAVLLTLLAASPVRAVRVKPQNCLPDSMLSSPGIPFLHWTAVAADVVFEPSSRNHSLQFTAWGNVSGSQYAQALPPPSSADWQDVSKYNGKIMNTENMIKLTTLVRKIEQLSSTLWSHPTDFCTDGLTNGTCPLPPVFKTTGELAYTGDLPSINITHDMFSSYAFASLVATMIIISGDDRATSIGCISTIVTPDLGRLAPVIATLPLVVLLLSGLAVVLTIAMLPPGSSSSGGNILHWSSGYGHRRADLLRLVTPGFGDCLQYIQFVVLSGALSLSYPGFFQPVVSQLGWSALMFNQSFVTSAPGWQGVVDGVYVTNTGDDYGLHALSQYVGMAESADIWAGMAVWWCGLVGAVLILCQVAVLAQWVSYKGKKNPVQDLRGKIIPFSVGNIVRLTFNYLLVPIVALSCFQLVVAGTSPSYIVALAAITVVVLLGVWSYLSIVIIRTKPKRPLFDDLSTLLCYGPLYNTWPDQGASFAIIPVLLNFIRGIAIGGLQSTGLSQIILLAACEAIQILAPGIFRPFYLATSLVTVSAILRLVSLLLMVAFVPSLGIAEGPKGWVGYAILIIHGCILTLVFFCNALWTIIEVAARKMSADRGNISGSALGGFEKRQPHWRALLCWPSSYQATNSGSMTEMAPNNEEDGTLPDRASASYRILSTSEPDVNSESHPRLETQSSSTTDTPHETNAPLTAAGSIGQQAPRPPVKRKPVPWRE